MGQNLSQNFGVQDINAAIDIIRERIPNASRYSKYASPFLFSTENQAGINKVISYKDKDVVTMASSGDQYLGAVYYGGKTVDIFDINRLTYFMTCLKIAAVYALDYKEFMNFFLPQDTCGRFNPSFWDSRIFRRLLPIMPSIVGAFWERVIYAAQVKGNYGHLLDPFYHNYRINNIMSGMPFYQCEEEYYKLQSLLRKREFPKFFEADIRDLSDVLTSSYDIVYLSNALECLIYDRISELENDDLLKNIDGVLNSLKNVPEAEADFILDTFKAFAFNKAADDIQKELTNEVLASAIPHLNENGIILLGYSSNRPIDKTDDWLFGNDKFDVDAIASKFNPSAYSQGKADTDLVLTYRPKKKISFIKRTIV